MKLVRIARMKPFHYLLISIFVVVLLGYVGVSLYMSGPKQQPAPVAKPAEPKVEPMVEIGNPPATPPEQPAVVIASKHASPLPEEGIKGQYLNVGNFADLSVGQRIAFHVPQEDSDFPGYVSEVKTTPSGNQIVSGMLEDAGREYRFVITIGALQTFGTLYTSKGRYQMEVRDGVARLVSAAEIDRDLDYSKPDFRIPEVPQTKE